MMITCKLFICFVVVLCFDTVFSKKLPDYITPCHRNDPQLTKCVMREVEKLRPRLLNGIPEMQIPSLNPLRLDEAGLDNGQNFKASFKNIELWHAEEFIVNDLSIDLDNIKMILDITLPRLRIQSTYNINGKILVLQLDGKGPADGNFTNVNAKVVIDGHTVNKNGKEYLDFKNPKLTLKIGKPVFKFDKIFGDNEELNVQTNKVINENIEDLLQELDPVVSKVVLEIVYGLIKRIMSRFSLDELFPR